MVTLWQLLPLSVGICIVLQGVLNKQFSLAYGLATAGFVNGLVFALLCFLFFLYAQKFPLELPEFVPPRLRLYELRPWHLLPGVCGFVIVILTPWSISQLGAAPVFTIIIAAQILFSLLWDHFGEGLALSPLKILGLILVVVGASIFNFAKAN